MDAADRPHRLDLRALGAAHHEPLRGQALSATAALFRFVQVELPWPLGPPTGRHVLRAAADAATGTGPISHVVVLATLASPRRGPARRARPRTRPVEPEPDQAPVVSGRATVISVLDPFAAEDQARAWLQRAGEPEVAEALRILGGVVHAHRLATADPWLAPVTRSRVIAVRIGYGAGEQVADGRWTAARELAEPGGPSRGPRRRRAVAGSEARLAALLGGAERSLVCEELVLRARLDLDCDRPREAALQMLVALDAAIAELAADGLAPALAERVQALRERRASAAAAAQAALTGAPSSEAQEDVAATLAMLEAALRARAAGA